MSCHSLESSQPRDGTQVSCIAGRFLTRLSHQESPGGSTGKAGLSILSTLHRGLGVGAERLAVMRWNAERTLSLHLRPPICLPTCWCPPWRCSSILSRRTGFLHSGQRTRNVRQQISWRARRLESILLLLQDQEGGKAGLFHGIKYGAIFCTWSSWMKFFQDLKH